ncbi:MAG: deoxyguanosinetriphosphate triphosphohydrolase [Alphaproteobacteria bacterium]|nr:deoxyguanosinetriphosphate triphosphohydrolase [Alphaproteobacteria bacterium]
MVDRAPYASDPARSRGRRVVEDSSALRSAFQRDRDRIIHCTAFRRLKHKTQVFVYHEGDHYRTRLTHSIEVAQIARTLCRALGLDEDLGEALALAHDFGHTPFGHAGEEALDAAMAPFGGFDHNAQTLRIVARLERRYATFDGLNLTWETLEGLIKHNGPLTGPHARPRATALPETITEFDHAWPLDLHTFASAEAQVAALADDIAYDNHDLDDGLRAGLFSLDDLADLPIAGAALNAVWSKHGRIDQTRTIHEMVRRMIDRMVGDVFAETKTRLAADKPTRVEDVRSLSRSVVAFSDALAAEERVLRRFLYDNMYRHQKVNAMTDHARRVVRELFGHFLADPGGLPEEWRGHLGAAGSRQTARLIADYIAGMTDRFAMAEHHRLFGSAGAEG